MGRRTSTTVELTSNLRLIFGRAHRSRRHHIVDAMLQRWFRSSKPSLDPSERQSREQRELTISRNLNAAVSDRTRRCSANLSSNLSGSTAFLRNSLETWGSRVSSKWFRGIKTVLDLVVLSRAGLK